MVTVIIIGDVNHIITVITTNGMRLDGYSYDCKWHEIRRLQLQLQMARG